MENYYNTVYVLNNRPEIVFELDAEDIEYFTKKYEYKVELEKVAKIRKIEKKY